tara:strand:+ start:256 stop:639 length:384 start_codon:yes stop_codon:yes gene_type:complete
MARPKKTKIHLDKNSLREFMQEIYNDCVNVANTARKELNERKHRAEIDDINDESLIGKVNNDTLKIIDATIDKKLALAKLQSQIVASESNNKNDSVDNTSFTEEDKNILRDLFKEKSSSENVEYDLD